MTSTHLPESADVVIVGVGGIVGSSVAYFLSELGVGNIVGLEKSASIPTDIGSTAHASDFIFNTAHDKLSNWTTAYSRNFYDENGGILNDPVVLRPNQNEFWYSLADSDMLLWLQAVNLGRRWDVDIAEIDVCPVQIQGPRSEALMADLVDEGVHEIPYYGLMEAEVAGVSILISQSGFTGEKGYEVYVRDASLHAEKVWQRIREVGQPHGLEVIAPAHHRRIAAGILSWGQDMDFETSPFQVNLAYQVPRRKAAEYIGKTELERQRAEIEAGRFPFKLKLAGMRFGGKPVTDYASDFWLVRDGEGTRVGYLTSPWWSPELESNIALGYVPFALSQSGTRLSVELPEPYAEQPGVPVDATVCDIPFRPSVNPSARERARARGQDSAD